MLSEFVKVAKVGELAEGEMMMVAPNGEEVLLAHINGDYFAMDNWCSHTGGMLDQGELLGYEVECPIHEGRFDLRTGEATQFPPEEAQQPYAVLIEGDDILVGPP